MRSLTIPFPGFYESDLSHMIDYEAELFCENEVERQAYAEYYPEDFQPEPLRLDAAEISDALYWSISTPKLEISRDYLAEFDSLASEELGFPLRLRFETVTSPREYNFETDRLFAEISNAAALRLFRLSKTDSHSQLRRVIRERFTSYDGFSSFYSNELQDWLEKPFATWDHNELGTLLIALLPEPEDRWSQSIVRQVCDALNDSSYQYFESSLDWKKYEGAIAEKRAEKLEELSEGERERYGITEDGERAAPRCPFTPDLFAQTPPQTATDAR